MKNIKYLISSLLAIMLLFVSCAESPIPIESANEVHYPTRRNVIESPTRILYSDEGWLCYYNKLDGKTYPFCFEPLCKHDLADRLCTSNLFVLGDIIGNMVYSSYDNRFYFLRGHKLCSMSFDGSDVRIEHSFGETGNPYEMDYELGILADISSYQNFVFFLWVNSDTGHYNLMRFDIKQGKCENLSEKAGLTDNMGRYFIVDDGILFLSTMAGDNALYHADFNFEHITFFSEYGTAAYLSKGCFDGETFYMTQRNYEENTEGKKVLVSADIVAFSIRNGEQEVIYSDTVEPEILAVTEEYIYFKKRENALVGYELLPTGWMNEYFNQYAKIFRLDRKTKQCETILDDISCEVGSIMLMDDKILIEGEICKVSETDASKDSAMMVGTFDKKGYIVDIKKVGTEGAEDVPISQETTQNVQQTTQVETTAATTENTEKEVIQYNPDDYPDDPFQYFEPYSGNLGIYFDKASLDTIIFPDDPIMIRFRVLELLEDSDGFAEYRVQLTGVYGTDQSFDMEKIYGLGFLGSSDTPRYGRPMLEIGAEYARVIDITFDKWNIMQKSLTYKIVDTEEGTFVYSYGVDLSELKCAIPITDEKENAIYEVGKHDKILAYLAYVNQPVPVFEYKCEVGAFIAEIQAWEAKIDN